MLSYFCNNQRFTFCLTVDFFHYKRPCKHIRMIFQRIFSLVGFNLLKPRSVILLFEIAVQYAQDLFHISVESIF